MLHDCSIAYGELREWPTKERLGEILRDGGLQVTVGTYSVRIDDCSHFLIEQYGGDLGDPVIEANADTVTEMLHDAGRVSRVLADAGVAHRFEVHDEHDTLAGYFHYDWPLVDTPRDL